MIFGHNPDFTELARLFARKHMLELPTCGIARFVFNCRNWADVGKEMLISESMDFPKKE
jgi:phosphohistidine phosphatase SixA